MLTNKIDSFLKKPCIYKITQIYLGILKVFETIALPILMFFIRFWMAKIFWYSGLTKLSSWRSTIYLFQYEYKVPLIPAELTAYFATTFELVCPILLVLGFGARLATLPLLAMTVVIQLTYLDLIDHYYWAILLGVILFYGPGTLSLDQFISKKCRKR